MEATADNFQLMFAAQPVSYTHLDVYKRQELARRIGSDRSYISRVESGQTEPKVSTFYPRLSSKELGYIDIHPFVLNADGTSKPVS